MFDDKVFLSCKMNRYSSVLKFLHRIILSSQDEVNRNLCRTFNKCELNGTLLPLVLEIIRSSTK